MTGLRQGEDRHMVPIQSIAYKVVRDVPIPDSGVEVVFHHQNFLHTPRFYARVFLHGREIPLEAMQMPAVVDDKAAFAAIALSQETAKDRLPLTLQFGPGRFTVLSIDSNTKTARVRKDVDWGDVPVKITETVYR
jgi:hypothetical protein